MSVLLVLLFSSLSSLAKDKEKGRTSSKQIALVVRFQIAFSDFPYLCIVRHGETGRIEQLPIMEQAAVTALSVKVRR